MESSNYRSANASHADAGTAHGADEGLTVERTVSALQSYFSQHADTHCLLAVDPSRRILVDRPEDGVLFGKQRTVPIAINHDGFPEAHRPYLIELDLSTREGAVLLAESVRLAIEDRSPDLIARGHGQRIGGWLESKASAQEVASHLSQHVLQTDEQGRQCALRFYDTRALGLIWRILSSGQQQTMLGPVMAWHALDPCAKPCVYKADAPLQSSLLLTREQWQMIHRHGVVNKALGLHMHAMQRQPRPKEVENALDAATRAEKHGLEDPDDVVIFIRHALSWHPRFDAHPRVRAALQQLSEEMLYSEAISEISADEIEDIQRGAWIGELPVH